MVLQVPSVGFGKITLTLGPLDVFLHELHRLLHLCVFIGEGLHPLDQLAPLFSNSSYPLQTHQDYEAKPIYNIKVEHRRCSTDLDLLHHFRKGGL